MDEVQSKLEGLWRDADAKASEADESKAGGAIHGSEAPSRKCVEDGRILKLPVRVVLALLAQRIGWVAHGWERHFVASHRSLATHGVMPSSRKGRRILCTTVVMSFSVDTYSCTVLQSVSQ